MVITTFLIEFIFVYFQSFVISDIYGQLIFKESGILNCFHCMGCLKCKSDKKKFAFLPKVSVFQGVNICSVEFCLLVFHFLNYNR